MMSGNAEEDAVMCCFYLSLSFCIFSQTDFMLINSSRVYVYLHV